MLIQYLLLYFLVTISFDKNSICSSTIPIIIFLFDYSILCFMFFLLLLLFIRLVLVSFVFFYNMYFMNRHELHKYRIYEFDFTHLNFFVVTVRLIYWAPIKFGVPRINLGHWNWPKHYIAHYSLNLTQQNVKCIYYKWTRVCVRLYGTPPFTRWLTLRNGL